MAALRSSFRVISRARVALPAVASPRVAAMRWGGMATRSVSTTRYSIDHEYVTFDKDTNIGTVGITDYAQKALGDVVFVELPAQDSEVTQGDAIGAVESVKAASDIYAPVSGVIMAINEALGDQPGLLNKSPEEKGWLCKIKMSTPAEFDNLLNAEAYKSHCDGGSE